MERLKRLENGKVLRGAQIVNYSDLTDEEARALELQESAVSNVETYLDTGSLLLDLFQVDGAYSSIQNELETSDFLSPAEAAVYDMRIKVLSKRAALLSSLLRKTLGDKKTVDVTANHSFGVNTAEGLPDEILMAAIAGTLSEKERSAVEALLMANDKKH